MVTRGFTGRQRPPDIAKRLPPEWGGKKPLARRLRFFVSSARCSQRQANTSSSIVCRKSRVKKRRCGPHLCNSVGVSVCPRLRLATRSGCTLNKAPAQVRPERLTRWADNARNSSAWLASAPMRSCQ
jgi:hypothetical protein